MRFGSPFSLISRVCLSDSSPSFWNTSVPTLLLEKLDSVSFSSVFKSSRAVDSKLFSNSSFEIDSSTLLSLGSLLDLSEFLPFLIGPSLSFLTVPCLSPESDGRTEATETRSTPRSSCLERSSSLFTSTRFELRITSRVSGLRLVRGSFLVSRSVLFRSSRMGEAVASFELELTASPSLVVLPGGKSLREYNQLHGDRLHLLQLLIENEISRLSVWQNTLGETTSNRNYPQGADRSAVSFASPFFDSTQTRLHADSSFSPFVA